MNPELRRTINKIRTSKKELIAQILTVFIVPIILIQYDIIPVQARVPTLIIFISLLVAILIKEKWTFTMLGMTMHRFHKYLLPYILFTTVGVLFISLLSDKIGYEEITKWWTHRHFLYLFFVVSLFQEVGYRAYLMPALGKLIHKPILIIFVNALIFTLLHSIFPHLYISLPLAFIGGIGFAIMYMRYPSLPLIIISHSILNFFAVLVGFFVIPGVTY